MLLWLDRDTRGRNPNAPEPKTFHIAMIRGRTRGTRKKLFNLLADRLEDLLPEEQVVVARSERGNAKEIFITGIPLVDDIPARPKASK